MLKGQLHKPLSDRPQVVVVLKGQLHVLIREKEREREREFRC